MQYTKAKQLSYCRTIGALFNNRTLYARLILNHYKHICTKAKSPPESGQSPKYVDFEELLYRRYRKINSPV